MPPYTAYRIVHSVPHWLARLAARIDGRRRYSAPTVFQGVPLENPVGLAAGLDKDGDLLWVSWSLGFGFTVVGSVLPRRHQGARVKVLERLPDGGLVNRLGLPSKGAVYAAKRLESRPEGLGVAVNIAALEPEGYPAVYERVAPLADWVEVNISCPNTREHGTFERPEWARRILHMVTGLDPARPVLVKLPPVEDKDIVLEYVDAVRESGASGVVASNTIKVDWRGEQAGLSGPRLYPIVKQMVRVAREHLPTGYSVVAVGGIDSPDKALELLEEGADLVELLTSLLYHGPGRVWEILEGVARRWSRT